MNVHIPIYGEDLKKKLLNFATLKATAQDIPNLTVKVSPGTIWNYSNSGLSLIEFLGGTSDTFILPIFEPKWYIVALSTSEEQGLVIIEGDESEDPDFPHIAFGRYPIAAVYLTPSTTKVTNDIIFDITTNI